MICPKILTSVGGKDIKSVEEWEKFRRGEILSLFEEFLFGRRPSQCFEKPQFELDNEYLHPLSGYMDCRKVNITVSGYSFPIHVFLPKTQQRNVPIFVYIMHVAQSNKYNIDAAEDIPVLPIRYIIDNGFGLAVIKVCDVANESNQGEKQGVLKEFGSDNDNAWGEISAWAWSMSKVVDYLETLDEVDKTNIYAVGHSRGGKTALWAGATDTRFSLVISNNSGCSGAAISRGKQGETVKDINTTFPNWFCGNYKKYNDNEEFLPFDQHMLLALIAPRHLYVTSASEDLWAAPDAEFRSCLEVLDAYALYSLSKPEKTSLELQPYYRNGRVCYHLREGKHAITPYDWERFINYAKKYVANVAKEENL